MADAMIESGLPEAPISVLGKVALVTGATSGIGRGIAELFARSGAKVVLSGRDEARGAQACEAITRSGGEAAFIAGDIRDAAFCATLVEDAAARHGRLDILVNSAAILHPGPAERISDAQWHETLAINVSAVFFLSRAAVAVMQRQGGGAIINVASEWGLVGGRGAVAYCASKGAVIQMTRAMALDYATQGIRVNAMCPGATYTPMLDNEFKDLGISAAEGEKYTSEAVPLQRIAQVAEVAPAALFLASDAAAYITGIALPVDGGSTAD